MNVRTGAVLALLVPKMRGEILRQFLLQSSALGYIFKRKRNILFYLGTHQSLTLGVSDMSGVKTAVGHLCIDTQKLSLIATYSMVSLLTQNLNPCEVGTLRIPDLVVSTPLASTQVDGTQ
jgi:hypothetical protein